MFLPGKSRFMFNDGFFLKEKRLIFMSKEGDSKFFEGGNAPQEPSQENCLDSKARLESLVLELKSYSEIPTVPDNDPIPLIRPGMTGEIEKISESVKDVYSFLDSVLEKNKK